MSLSFWRRTRDALLKPSVYFKRARQEHSVKDSFAYLLILSLIEYGLLLIPLALFAALGQGSVTSLLVAILIVPGFMLAILLQSAFIHISAMALSGQRKRWIDSFKLAVFGPGILSIISLLLAYLFYGVLSIMIGFSTVSALSVASTLTLVGFFQNLMAIMIIALAIQMVYYAYYGFVMVVGMHKVHKMPLEKSFWANTLTVILQLVFFGVLYSFFLLI